MKIEKAIEDLKDINTILKTQHMCKVLDDELTKKDVEDYKSRFASVNLAISALEKQMARSPVNRCATFLIAECPRCNGTVSFHHKHCHWCGQNLDWEVENE